MTDTATLSATASLAERMPDAARDIRLNLQSVLETSSLNDGQRFGVAVACAIAARNPFLKTAIMEDAGAKVEAAVIDDGIAAAALMGMNNVFYRFRHMIGKPSYETKPARLRMQRIAKPATNKADFELFCLAVSAINGCEACVRSHEHVVLEGGLSEDNVHDAVRIAAVIHAAAVALEA
jgi:lipoyl-dependent peroxiredoxin subunit D